MFALWFGDVGNSLFGMIALALRVQVINIADGRSSFFRQLMAGTILQDCTVSLVFMNHASV